MSFKKNLVIYKIFLILIKKNFASRIYSKKNNYFLNTSSLKCVYIYRDQKRESRKKLTKF